MIACIGVVCGFGLGLGLGGVETEEGGESIDGEEKDADEEADEGETHRSTFENGLCTCPGVGLLLPEEVLPGFVPAGAFEGVDTAAWAGFRAGEGFDGEGDEDPEPRFSPARSRSERSTRVSLFFAGEALEGGGDDDKELHECASGCRCVAQNCLLQDWGNGTWGIGWVGMVEAQERGEE